MALRTPPGWLQNGSHTAEDDRLRMQAILSTTGIIGASSLAVTQNSTPNMTVQIASGWACIVGTYQANMGVYTFFNDAAASVTITTAPAVNNRIDLVVATINDTYYTGASNNVVFSVIAGTVAASPVAPATPTNSIAIAQVYVGTNVTSIVNANITDVRVKSSTSLTPSALAPNAVVTAPEETWTLSASAATGTINFDCVTQGVLYYTGNASANWTLNFRGNATTSLATLLAVNVPITVSFLNTNGATAYYPSAFTIDGSAVTPKWSGGTAPSAGNASAIDAYQFTIIKTSATPTYTVLAAGPVKYA